MSNFNFCYLPSLNLRQDLEDHLLDNNSEFKDCECNSDHVNHRCESVFDKSRYEVKRYRKWREMNIPIGRNKKKPAGKRKVETVNVTTTNNYVKIEAGAYDGLLIMSNFPQIHL